MLKALSVIRPLDRKLPMPRSRPVLCLLSLLASLFTSTASATADEGKAAVLMVVIEEIRSASGQVHVGVWSDPEGFGKEKSRIAGTSAAVNGPSQTLVIRDLEPGTYALAAYHDENDNGDFDRTWIGLPDEGLGFSNGAWITLFGAPSFDSASIELKHPSTRAVIALRY